MIRPVIWGGGQISREPAIRVSQPAPPKLYRLTLFPDLSAATKREVALTLEQLCELIVNPRAANKIDLPLLSLQGFGSTASGTGCLRHNANVRHSWGVVGDYDGEQLGLEEAIEKLNRAQIEAVVYPSPSYTPERPRWRVLAWYSEARGAADHARMMARLNGALEGVLAAESWTLSQGFFYGRPGASLMITAAQVLTSEGQPIDERDELDLIAIGKPGGRITAAPDAGPHTPGSPEADIDDIRATLDAIPNDWVNWVEWNTLALAVCAACGGSEDGYEALVKWSKQNGEYDPSETERMWRQFRRSPPTRSGFGSLVHWARQADPNFVLPSKRRLAETREASLAEFETRPQPPGGPDKSDKSDEPSPSVPQVARITVEAGLRHIAADEGLRALDKAGVAFYGRDKSLVRVARTKAKTWDKKPILVPGITQVRLSYLRRVLGQAALWEKTDRRGKLIRIDPPKDVAEQIAEMIDEWPFPPLLGVIGCPTLRPDGSLLDRPGYDHITGYYLDGTLKMPPVPQDPTKDDAVAALRLLDGLLDGFPFADDASKAVALSGFITPVVRAIMPVAPLHLSTTPEAGTGKSYLVDCQATVATGERSPVLALSPSVEETEKRLIGAALAGFPVLSVDNSSQILRGDFFCQITERPVMLLRKFGSLELYRIENSATCFANGNNARVADDLVRRTLRNTMDANTEAPEERTFTTKPLEMIQRDRGKYVAACLTIPLAYRAAGMPGRLPPLASFEVWSDNVRSPLAWLDRADPVETMEALRADDPVRAGRRQVFAAWGASTALSVDAPYHSSEIVEAAERDPILKDALLGVAQDRKERGQIDALRLGQWLNRNRDTVAAGYKLLVDRSDRKRPTWRLVAVDP